MPKETLANKLKAREKALAELRQCFQDHANARFTNELAMQHRIQNLEASNQNLSETIGVVHERNKALQHDLERLQKVAQGIAIDKEKMSVANVALVMMLEEIRQEVKKNYAKLNA